MKILKEGRIPKIPQHKTLKCNWCKCKMKANFEDAYASWTILNVPAFYVDCPYCGNSIYYFKRQLK